MATQWPCIASLIGLAPLASSTFSTSPRLYGVPRTRKFLGGGTPSLLQPFEVGLEAAAGDHHRLGAHRCVGAFAGERGRLELVALDFEVGDLGFVDDVDAELFRRMVIGVDQRLAAAEEKRIGARQVQRAAQRAAGNARRACTSKAGTTT